MQKNFIRNTICMTAIVMSMVMTAACGTSTSSSEIASSAPSVQSVANLPAAVTESKAVVVSVPSTQASTAAKSASVATQAATKSYAESTSVATKAVEAAPQAVTEAATEAEAEAVDELITDGKVEVSANVTDAVTETADTTEEAAEDAADAGSSDDNSVVEDAGEAQVNEEPANDSISQSGHYVLNKSTKKFHYAGCASAKQIKASNYAEFDGDRDTLISRGYSACKKCNP
ncbi:MAG: hypothetical protein U0J42_04880 [[Bacteroides] pectinophilus]|nr:hypothetical protein [[Bacteroides] pectinophilus]